MDSKGSSRDKVRLSRHRDRDRDSNNNNSNSIFRQRRYSRVVWVRFR